MKKIGAALLVLGIVALIAVLSMDTSVPTENWDRVYNLGLMQEKQSFLMLSGLIVVIGVALMRSGLKSSPVEQTGKGVKALSIFIYLVAAGIGAGFIYSLTPAYEEQKYAKEREMLKFEESRRETRRETEEFRRRMEETIRGFEESKRARDRLSNSLGIPHP